MDGPYDTGPPPWNPSIEAWPGGPHLGAVAQMQDEEVAARLGAEAGRAAESSERAEAAARRRLVNHLLLQR